MVTQFFSFENVTKMQILQIHILTKKYSPLFLSKFPIFQELTKEFQES